MPGGRVEAAFPFVLLMLAQVLLSLAFVRDTLALIDQHVAAIRDVVAIVRGRVTTIRLQIAHLAVTSALGTVPALGRATLMLGVQPLQLGGLLVVLHRFAVQLGGLPMEIAQSWVRRFGHQALAAFGRLAFTVRPLARSVTELLGPPGPVAMV